MLENGFIRIGGRDKNLRPYVIVTVTIAQKDKVSFFDKNIDDPYNFHLQTIKDAEGQVSNLLYILEYMRKYMMVPGKVENTVVLVDLKGLSIYDVPV